MGSLLTRPMNVHLDEYRRSCLEHCFVDFKEQGSRAVQEQLRTIDHSLPKLCMALSCQERLGVPVVVAAPMEGNTNHQVLFITIMMAAMYSQRKVVFSASGDTTWQGECQAVADRLKDSKVSLGELLEMTMSLVGMDVAEDGIFSQLLASF